MDPDEGARDGDPPQLPTGGGVRSIGCEPGDAELLQRGANGTVDLGARSVAERNRVVVLLSFKAGLRAKEIAGVTWGMLTDTENQLSDALLLTNKSPNVESLRFAEL